MFLVEIIVVIDYLIKFRCFVVVYFCDGIEVIYFIFKLFCD